MVIDFKLLQKNNLEIKAMDQSYLKGSHEKKWVHSATSFIFYNKFISHLVAEFGF